MKNNIPEVGDILVINPEAIQEMKDNRQQTLGSNDERDWLEGLTKHTKKPFKVVDIEHFNAEITVITDAKIHFGQQQQAFVIRASTGAAVDYTTAFLEPLFKLYNTSTGDNSIYCSCNGPRKESMTFSGEKFYICETCKKEQR